MSSNQTVYHNKKYNMYMYNAYVYNMTIGIDQLNAFSCATNKNTKTIVTTWNQNIIYYTK